MTKHTTKRKINILAIVSFTLTVLAIGAIVFDGFMAKNYYALNTTVFICVLGIIVCVFLISMVLLFFGLNYKDKLLQIINTVLVSIILVVSIVGGVYLYKLNKEVDKIIDNSGSEQYETISGVFVSYDDETCKELKDIAGKTIGVIYDTETGTGSIAQSLIEKEQIEVKNIVECSTMNDLFYGLIDGTIDIAVMPAGYRAMYENDDNSDYTNDLNKMNDFYSFEEKVKVGINETANQDITKEPFNVLLIGFAQNNSKSPYGLSDTIMLATVNPNTMTVSLASIARDSYVPISCYGGTEDKINAARGTSRQCLLDTVSDLVGEDINYYVEINFQGVVDLVDAVGGIVVSNPVQFVGQSSSLDRGYYNVLVPAGDEVFLTGERALAFARERHAYDSMGGDLLRQMHQQEVIRRIAEKIFNLSDVNSLMKVIEACGSNVSTNISINQMTSMFNHIITNTSTIGIPPQYIVNIQSLRVTGYSDWHYNRTLGLPVWIYRLYEGSLSQILDCMDQNLNKFDKIEQVDHFKFFEQYPYCAPTLYDTEFDEVQYHETLPDYIPYLTRMTYAEAVKWADSVGVTLKVNELSTSGYSESQYGSIVAQDPRYGLLVSDYKTVTISVVGGVGEKVPNFVGQYLDVATKWANEKKYSISSEVITVDSSEYDMAKAGLVYSQTPQANSVVSEKGGTLSIRYYDYFTIDANKQFIQTSGTNKLEDAKVWISKYMRYADTVTYSTVVTDDTTKIGTIKAASFGSSNTGLNNAKNLKITSWVKAESFSLTAKSSDDTKGTVRGTGTYSNAGNAKFEVLSVTSGYKFTGWYEGDTLVSDKQTYEFPVTKAVTYTAKFEEIPQHTISVALATGCESMGSVSGGGKDYEAKTVTITASPNSNYRFVKWDDGDTNANRTITIGTSDKTYTATFEEIPQKYNVSGNVASGCESMGSVSGGGQVDKGSSTTLTASANEGYSFVSWDGECSGQGSSCTLSNVTSDISVTATFEKNPE